MLSATLIQGIVSFVRDLSLIAALGGLAALVTKKGVTWYFDRRLEEHRVELQKEKYKFTELHQERGQIIKDLYVNMLRLESAMEDVAQPLQGSEQDWIDSMEEAANAGAEFKKHFERNKIYLPKSTCEQIEEFYSELDEIFGEYRKDPHGFRGSSVDQQHGDDKLKEIIDLWERVDDGPTEELKQEIEAEFRELLGIDSDPEL